MPSRILKESIHDSESVSKMTDIQFRLWVNLITYVDDYGRGDARPAIIKGKCFPILDRFTEAKIKNALRELAVLGSIVLYEVNGKPYLCFPSWGDHQNIRAKRPKYPGPNDENAKIQASANICMQMQADVPVIRNTESNTFSNANARERTSAHFTPPTLEQVKAYCDERINGIDPQHFIDYYERQGWKLSNGRAMKDWKAAIRTWETRERKNPAGSSQSQRQESSVDVLAQMVKEGL